MKLRDTLDSRHGQGRPVSALAAFGILRVLILKLFP